MVDQSHNVVAAKKARGAFGRGVIILALALYVVNPFVAFVAVMADRVIPAEWFAVSDYTKILNPIILALAVVHIFRVRNIRSDNLVLIGYFAVGLAISVGLISGGTWRFFISHLFVGVFVVSMYFAGLNTTLDRAWLERVVSRSCVLLLTAYALAITLFWSVVALTKNPLFLGISTQPLLLPLVWYLARKKSFGLALTILLLLSAGKRAPLVAVAVVLVLHFLAGLRGGLFIKAGIATLFVATVAVAAFALDPLIPWTSLPESVQYVYGKWQLLNPLSDAFDAGLASSGRTSEITYAFAKFVSEPTNWIFGAGYGWSFVNVGSLGLSDSDFESHYLHFSPANFVLQYGLLIGVAYLFLIVRRLNAIERPLLQSTGRSGLHYSLFLFLIGLLVAGFFGYDYGTDPMIFFLLGFLTTLARGVRASVRAGLTHKSNALSYGTR